MSRDQHENEDQTLNARPHDDSTHRSTEEVDDMHALAAAYALHALDPAESAAFDAHLDGCGECRADLAEFSDTAALLGEAGAVPAPDSLRTSVLAAISRTPQEAPRPVRDPWRQGESAAPAQVPLPAPVSLAERRARRTPRWAGLLAAACTVAAVTATGWGWSADREAERAQQQASAANRQAERMAELLTAPGSRVQTVTGRSGATATIVHAGTEAVVIGAGLPEVPADRGYQLWLIDGGTIRPAGMLSRDSAGHYTAYVVDTDGVPTLGVTEEPAGGSQQPTSEPVLAADISQA